MTYIPKFKVGDVINSSLTSPQVIDEIRVGVDTDKSVYYNPAGELCYVLHYLGGKQNVSVFACKAIDSDHHLKGSEMYEEYQTLREEFYKKQGITI